MRTFTQWLETLHYTDRKPGPVMPQCNQVEELILQAGRRGISYSDLAARIDLKPETLQLAIQSLVDFARVKVYWKNGQRVYSAY